MSFSDKSLKIDKDYLEMMLFGTKWNLRYVYDKRNILRNVVILVIFAPNLTQSFDF